MLSEYCTLSGNLISKMFLEPSLTICIEVGLTSPAGAWVILTPFTPVVATLDSANKLALPLAWLLTLKVVVFSAVGVKSVCEGVEVSATASSVGVTGFSDTTEFSLEPVCSEGVENTFVSSALNSGGVTETSLESTWFSVAVVSVTSGVETSGAVTSFVATASSTGSA